MSKSIVLVVFNESYLIDWKLGSKFSIDYSTQALRSIKEEVLQSNADYVLFWDAVHPIPTEAQLERVLQSKGNLWHIGSKAGMATYPELLDSIQPTNMIHLSVSEEIDHTSWKNSFRGSLMSLKIFELIPLAEYSNSLDIIGLDFGYKAIQSGVFTRYSSVLAQEISPVRPEISCKDEFLFLKNNFDKKAFIWSYLMNIFKISPFEFWKVLKEKKKHFGIVFPNKIDRNILKDKDTSVSVVIATLERYPFLEKELLELSKLEIPLKEIIIIDQTPKEIRDKTFLNNFKQVPIKYIETDKIGQCSARNLGIEKAIGTFIWFLDDDMEEIPPNYLEKHLQTIYSFNADVSCGVPDEIGTKYINRSIPKIEISDGFPTNDVLAKKELLLQVGGFDIKMDQKQSEDQELGLRCFKKGALSIKNNQLRILHLRASKGGLRNHNVRKITFASSRKNLFERRFLHHSEVYLNLKHFGEKKVSKLILLNIRGTFIIRGYFLKKLVKVIFGIILLPNTLYTVSLNKRKANTLLKK
jgi:GT2 family glycosyltransferase